MAKAAEATAAAIRNSAPGMNDPHDRTAAMNMALTWEFFAGQVRDPPRPPPRTAAHYAEAPRKPDDDGLLPLGLALDTLTNLADGFTGLADAFSGGGGDFGGGGASGSW